ncbi:ATP-binding protein [Aeromonas jandaei]|uniref:ATP-binding protein n=1 Tax=Aeromonas jandaei TaxID=650 RepID=UPI003BA104C7
MQELLNAEVVSVYPNSVKIQIDKIEDFKIAEQNLRIGSFVEISDNENSKLLAVIENFSIEASENKPKKYILEAKPLGTLKNERFIRGGDELAIPPKEAKPAQIKDIQLIYSGSIEESKKFNIATLARCPEIDVPMDGDRFFNKHIAVVGATGSGKSHTVTKIVQAATTAKASKYSELNNSHIVIIDIHSEYKRAFPSSNYLSIEELKLPYWLLNSEELEELFIDSEANDHNQRSVFKEAVTRNKKKYSEPKLKDSVHYDSPAYFNMNEVLTYIKNRNNEKNAKSTNDITWTESSGGDFIFDETTAYKLFDESIKPITNGTSTGTSYGKFINFINRLENKITDQRLNFILGNQTQDVMFSDVLKQFIGFTDDNKKNVTIIDISGVPFEVLSITVSLISRILFEFGYFLKSNAKKSEIHSTPLLIIYEEAHKYAPKSGLAKYRSSLNAIERIAKEGRKYGVTLLIASQRPSEISETIFSQCNNFIAMRLTNPEDQSYVRRLLPDSLGNITDTLPTLKCGEAIIIGDAIVMPSLVKIDRCNPEPSSSDIPYFSIWKDKWNDVNFEKIIETWQQR